MYLTESIERRPSLKSCSRNLFGFGFPFSKRVCLIIVTYHSSRSVFFFEREKKIEKRKVRKVRKEK